MDKRVLIDPKHPGMDARVWNRVELQNAAQQLDLRAELIPLDELIIDFLNGSRLHLGPIWEDQGQGFDYTHTHRILGTQTSESGDNPFLNSKVDHRVGDEITIHGSG